MKIRPKISRKKPVPWWQDRKNDHYEVRVPRRGLNDPLAQKIWKAIREDPEPEIKEPRGRGGMETLFWRVARYLLSELCEKVGSWLEAVLPWIG